MATGLRGGLRHEGQCLHTCLVLDIVASRSAVTLFTIPSAHCQPPTPKAEDHLPMRLYLYAGTSASVAAGRAGFALRRQRVLQAA